MSTKNIYAFRGVRHYGPGVKSIVGECLNEPGAERRIERWQAGMASHPRVVVTGFTRREYDALRAQEAQRR